jgi:hypothetical protein
MAVVLPGKKGQVHPERFSGEIVQEHFFVYPFWCAPIRKTMYGIAHAGSGQPISMRATRSGALWCIHKLKTLPVGWCRSQLGDGEWDARSRDATTDALAGGLDHGAAGAGSRHR